MLKNLYFKRYLILKLRKIIQNLERQGEHKKKQNIALYVPYNSYEFYKFLIVISPIYIETKDFQT